MGGLAWPRLAFMICPETKRLRFCHCDFRHRFGVSRYSLIDQLLDFQSYQVLNEIELLAAGY